MTRMQKTDCNRKGTILIIIFVCLLIASTILLGAVGFSIRHRGQLRNELQLEQTYWLLDAGVGKAIERFQQQPEFESLELSTAETMKDYKGSIDIVVLERAEKTVNVRVTAKLERTDLEGAITQRSRVILIKNEKLNHDKTVKNKTETENDDERKR